LSLDTLDTFCSIAISASPVWSVGMQILARASLGATSRRGPGASSWAVTHGTIWLSPENSDAPLSGIPFPAVWLHSCCSLSNCCDLRSGTASALGSGSDYSKGVTWGVPMVPVPGGRWITPLNSTTTTPAHEYTRSVFVGPGVRRKGGPQLEGKPHMLRHECTRCAHTTPVVMPPRH
jgi:hypothetical protein